ncbi:MAG: hypothetical protein WDO74_34185 [Pseudomonadota bacterium]
MAAKKTRTKSAKKPAAKKAPKVAKKRVAKRKVAKKGAAKKKKKGRQEGVSLRRADLAPVLNAPSVSARTVARTAQRVLERAQKWARSSQKSSAPFSFGWKAEPTPVSLRPGSSTQMGIKPRLVLV